ncbi:elongation factor Tu, partial [Striga asiatica]
NLKSIDLYPSLQCTCSRIFMAGVWLIWKRRCGGILNPAEKVMDGEELLRMVEASVRELNQAFPWPGIAGAGELIRDENGRVDNVMLHLGFEYSGRATRTKAGAREKKLRPLWQEDMGPKPCYVKEQGWDSLSFLNELVDGSIVLNQGKSKNNTCESLPAPLGSPLFVNAFRLLSKHSSSTGNKRSEVKS